MRNLVLVAFVLLGRIGLAQTNTAPAFSVPPPVSKPVAASAPAKPGAPDTKAHPSTIAGMQATIDKLTQSNRDLIDLLKQQQSVLEDIQFDRRQQGRHIESLEERLEQTLLENTQLQNKVANLEAEAAVRPAMPAPAPVVAATTNAPAVSAPGPNATVAADPPPPASYLPPEEMQGPPGGKTWRRLLVLKGTDNKQTDIFQIRGRNWRVLWHNQDPADKKLKGTSGLFIDAFPKDDTIPQHVCAKVGSGGDTTDLDGPGNYFLKITASGGSWELAVEDLQ